MFVRYVGMLARIRKSVRDEPRTIPEYKKLRPTSLIFPTKKMARQFVVRVQTVHGLSALIGVHAIL